VQSVTPLPSPDDALAAYLEHAEQTVVAVLTGHVDEAQRHARAALHAYASATHQAAARLQQALAGGRLLEQLEAVVDPDDRGPRAA
jgi:predicted HD phosphohydrolase